MKKSLLNTPIYWFLVVCSYIVFYIAIGGKISLGSYPLLKWVLVLLNIAMGLYGSNLFISSLDDMVKIDIDDMTPEEDYTIHRSFLGFLLTIATLTSLIFLFLRFDMIYLTISYLSFWLFLRLFNSRNFLHES